MYIRLPAVLWSLAGIPIAVATHSVHNMAVFHLCLLCCCLCDVLLAAKPQSLRITRTAANSAAVRTPVTQKLTVGNGGKRTFRGAVRDVWPPSVQSSRQIFSFTLLPGETAQFSAQITPVRRGMRKSAHLTVRSCGPLRLAGRQKTFPTGQKLLALPPFLSRRLLPEKIRQLREIEGQTLLLRRGQGTEFDSLREYVPGDDVRAIDWRSTARLRKTVVRTWRPQRDRNIVILADTGRAGAMRHGRYPAFDAYLESIFLLSALAGKAGDKVSVFALGETIRAEAVKLAGFGAIHTLGAILADIEPTPTQTDWILGAERIRRLFRRPALIVILTKPGTGALSSGLEEAITLLKRHRIVIGTLRHSAAGNGPAETGIYREAASLRTGLEEAEIRRWLKSRNVTVTAGSPQTLPAKIADTYLKLKAGGKL